MARIFLALTFEKDFNDKIIEIKKHLKSNLLEDANIAWQRNDQHHLTVHFVGEMEPEQINQMNEDLKEINFKNLSRSIDLTAISFCSSLNLNIEIMLSISFAFGPSSFNSILFVIILWGVSDATFSISIPPSVLLIKAILEDSLSIKQDK